MWRDREGELVAGEQNAAAFLVAKIEIFFELGERCDSVFELPFPIVPEFRRDFGPMTRRMRDKLFPILFPCGKSDHFMLRTKTLMPLTIVSTPQADQPAAVLFNADQRPHRNLGEEPASGFARQTNATMRRRIIRHDALVHSEIKAT